MRLIDADALIGELHTTYLYDDDARKVVYRKIEEQPTLGGWISIKDRLPDADGIYFARLSDGQYKVLAFEESMGWYNDYEYGQLDVTHWMYLPEQPKEVK